MAPKARTDKEIAPHRLQAYYDFLALPDDERTIKRLWETYCERKQDGDTTVPLGGTHINNLYEWKKQDNWIGKIAEEKRKQHNAELVAATEIRKLALGKMLSILSESIDELFKLIKGAENDSVKLRAITALLNRTGFPEESRITAGKRSNGEFVLTASEIASPVSLPDDDADDMEYLNYALAQASGAPIE